MAMKIVEATSTEIWYETQTLNTIAHSVRL